MARKHKNILIARFSALGDIAMTIPAVYNACYANPEARFFFLTRKHPAQIFVNKPENLTVTGIDTNDYHGIGGMSRLASELREKYSIDLFLDLHDVLRTKLLRLFLKLRGVPSRHIHKGRRAKRALTRKNNKLLVQLKPTPERYGNVFYAAGVSMTNDFRSLYGAGKGNPEDFSKVTPPKETGETWIAIAPFAKHKGKIYPLDHLHKVVMEYASRPRHKLFILGFGPEESKQIETLRIPEGTGDAKPLENVYNMAEASLGIGRELSLLSHCDVMLSMDSANMHLASLVGLRTVSVWGATHPYAGFLGWNQRTSDICQLDLTCRPCSVFGDKPCMRGDYHCLAGIPPSLIIAKIDRR